jgi:hypothetical protein
MGATCAVALLVQYMLHRAGVQAAGVAGCAGIIALPDATEVHVPFVTVKVYVPAARAEIVVVKVEPVVVVPPGVAVIVQLPAGKPLNNTLPVASTQVGCVIVPTVGAIGVTGRALITTLAEATEVHPAELVTVYVCEPTAMPERVVLVVDPAMVPGLMVQLPAGKPLNMTLPVAKIQVG